MAALTFDDIPEGARTSDDRTKLYVRAEPKSRALTFDDTPQSTVAQAGETALNVGRNVLSGLDKGVAGLAGLPADFLDAAQRFGDWSTAKMTDRPLEEVAAENAPNRLFAPETLRQWGSRAAHEGSPLYHEPESRTDKYIQSAAEFVPSALIPGASVRNAVTMGIIPGLASEGAGQATEGTRLEPWARGAAALGAGLGGAWFNAPNAAGSAVSRAARGANQAQLDQAEQLFQEAQRQGVPITRAEAVQYVTNGATNLGNLQRVVEGSGQMRPFFAERWAQVDDAARRQFDQTLGPNAAVPSSVGPQLGQAAEGVVQDTQAAVNRASRPYYQAAEPQRVGPAVQQAFMSDPLYARTLQEVRNNPALNRTIENLPDDAVGVIDLVQRRMREQAETARVPGQASSSNLAAANFEDARRAPMAAADTVTGSRPGVAGAYEIARNVQQQLRQQYLEPLMAGPIGKLAAKEPSTRRAIEILFPVNPLPNSQAEIGQAVTTLSNRSPAAARQVVRAHVESVFNEATQRLQSGANEFGGAGFVAALRGNPQQAANLEAAVTALRGGQAYQGFDRFLQILEAQGMRQRIGSQTAFNQEVQAALKEGGTAEKALTSVAGAGMKLPQQVRDSVQRWRLGQNVDQIADVLTNPAAAALFRQLATAPSNSAKAAALVTRLTYMATENARTRE